MLKFLTTCLHACRQTLRGGLLMLCIVLAHNSFSAESLDKESLYQILVGEFAAWRGDYPQALEIYQAQAKLWDDAYMAERATHIAYYLKRYPDMLDNALLWQKYSKAADQSLLLTAIAYALNSHFNHAIESMRLSLSQSGNSDFTRLVNMLPEEHPAQAFYRLELQQLYLLHPKNADIGKALATLAKQQQDKEAAISYASNTIRNNPNDNDSIEYCVNILRHFQAHSDIVKAYKQALKAAPQNNALRQQFALYVSSSDLPQAIEQMQIVHNKLPDDNDYSVHLALLYLENEQMDKAKTLFEQAVDDKSQSPSAHYYLGLIAQFEDNTVEALRYFNAIESPAERQRIAVQIANAYVQNHQFDQALKTTDAALQAPESDRQKELLLITKASIYQASEKPQQALQVLDAAIKDIGASDDLLYQRAMLYGEIANNSAMQQDLRQILQRTPEHPQALNALGYTLADRGQDLDEALRMIEKAHQLLPQDAAILDSLGWVLYRLGRTDEALAYLQQAMAEYPDGEIAAHLGEALWISGNKVAAEKIFQEALQRQPNHRLLNETIDRLAAPTQ